MCGIFGLIAWLGDRFVVYWSVLRSIDWLTDCDGRAFSSSLMVLFFLDLQPFCDGTHKKPWVINGLKPVKFVAEETKEVWFCNCKQTKKKPFCDNSCESAEVQETRIWVVIWIVFFFWDVSSVKVYEFVVGSASRIFFSRKTKRKFLPPPRKTEDFAVKTGQNRRLNNKIQ